MKESLEAKDCHKVTYAPRGVVIFSVLAVSIIMKAEIPRSTLNGTSCWIPKIAWVMSSIVYEYNVTIVYSGVWQSKQHYSMITLL